MDSMRLQCLWRGPFFFIGLVYWSACKRWQSWSQQTQMLCTFTPNAFVWLPFYVRFLWKRIQKNNHQAGITFLSSQNLQKTWQLVGTKPVNYLSWLWTQRGSPVLQSRLKRLSPVLLLLTHIQTAVRLLPAQSIMLKRRKHDTGMKYCSENGARQTSCC